MLIATSHGVCAPLVVIAAAVRYITGHPPLPGRSDAVTKRNAGASRSLANHRNGAREMDEGDLEKKRSCGKDLVSPQSRRGIRGASGGIDRRPCDGGRTVVPPLSYSPARSREASAPSKSRGAAAPAPS